jgi:hypothetical protein
VLPVVDDALRGDDALLVDQKSERGGEDLISFGDAEAVLGEYRNACSAFLAPLPRKGRKGDSVNYQISRLEIYAVPLSFSPFFLDAHSRL